MELKENILNYEIYLSLRESVGWNDFSKEQAENVLNNSFYEKLGFKLLPHEFCGPGMRKVIRK